MDEYPYIISPLPPPRVYSVPIFIFLLFVFQPYWELDDSEIWWLCNLNIMKEQIRSCNYANSRCIKMVNEKLNMVHLLCRLLLFFSWALKPVSPSVSHSVCLIPSIPVCLSICPTPFHLTVHPSNCPSVHLFCCPSLSIHQSVLLTLCSFNSSPGANPIKLFTPQGSVK